MLVALIMCSSLFPTHIVWNRDLGSSAILQKHICRWLRFTFSMNAYLVGRRKNSFEVVVNPLLAVCVAHTLFLASDIDSTWKLGNSDLYLPSPGLELRILCQVDSVISFVSSSSGGSLGPVQLICAQRWHRKPHLFTKHATMNCVACSRTLATFAVPNAFSANPLIKTFITVHFPFQSIHTLWHT